MRRSLAVGFASLALVTAVVAPVGTAAAAARGTLTITVLDRAGQPAHTRAQAINLRTNVTYYVRSGQTRSLPVGIYVVVVDIVDRSDQTSTVGAKRVTISGDRQVVFRARFGKPVRAWLRPTAPRQYTQSLMFSACVNGNDAVSGFSTRGKLFVLPKSIPEVAFAFSSAWAPINEASSDPRFLGAALHRGGVPDGMARTFRRSTLVPVQVVARRGPQSGQARIELAGDLHGTCLGSVRGLATYVTLPESFTGYVPPGRWAVSEEAQDFEVSNWPTLRIGHSYRWVLNRAAWGPTAHLPDSYNGRLLAIDTTDMFTDPTMSTYGAYANVTYRLAHADRTLLRTRVLGSQQRSVYARLPAPGWYTLTEYARRPADRLFPNALSPRADLRFRFYDDLTRRQQIRGYITQFLPTGLDRRDSAAPGSRTTVSLRPRRDKPSDDYLHQPTDAVRAISAWWSGNQGQSWHRLSVTHRDGHWAMVVPNPASGAVSLRATVIDVHGNSTRTTVIDGYAIG